MQHLFSFNSNDPGILVEFRYLAMAFSCHYKKLNLRNKPLSIKICGKFEGLSCSEPSENNNKLNVKYLLYHRKFSLYVQWCIVYLRLNHNIFTSWEMSHNHQLTYNWDICSWRTTGIFRIENFRERPSGVLWRYIFYRRRNNFALIRWNANNQLRCPRNLVSPSHIVGRLGMLRLDIEGTADRLHILSMADRLDRFDKLDM